MADLQKTLLASLDDAADLLAKADKGDADASRELIFKVSWTLQTGGAVPEELARWLANTLLTLANSELFATTLKLNAKRGRPKYDNEFEVAEFIYYSPLGRHKSDIEGCKQGVYTAAATRFGISATKAEDIYKKLRDVLAELDQLKNEEASKYNH